MGLVKQHRQKIIAIGLIILGPLSFAILFAFRLGLTFYWYSAFFVVFGLTLLPLAEPKKSKNPKKSNKPEEPQK